MLEGIAEQTLEMRVEGKNIVESIEKADFGDKNEYVKPPIIEKIKGSFLDAPQQDGKKKKNPVKTRKQLPPAVAREHKPKVFSIGNVRNIIKLMLYEDFVKPAGEWDFAKFFDIFQLIFIFTCLVSYFVLNFFFHNRKVP